MKKRIATIIGARPQFIKAATLSRIFNEHPKIEEILIHTGQHHDAMMSDVFFDELQIPKPSYRLNIQGGHHGQMTGRMLEAIEGTLLKEKPDAVLVYGDTNSTLAGALAASKLHIPVIHIEAGLRSFNKSMPEEINRILTDHVSSYLFCPTKTAVHNLKREGIEKNVHHVGDVMYDATLYAIDHITNNPHIQDKHLYLPDNFAFMTIHRAESTANETEFKKIMDYALDCARKDNVQIVFPVHPRTRPLIEQLSLDDTIMLLDPLSYFETQYCLSKASFVLTDSGGLQKEAYFHRVPCITLRSETEWVETIESGWNRLWKEASYKSPQLIAEYGTGKSAEKILETLLSA